MWCTRFLSPHLWLVLILCAACGCSDAEPASPPPTAATAGTQPKPEPSDPLVLFFGDSLSAGLHLAEEQAFPAVLQRLAQEAGHPFRLINAGISGDTTAGGLGRIAWSLKAAPDIVVLELGANDGLRGIDVQSIESNLVQMVEAIQASGADVLLLGMRLPPNYGPEYTHDFEAIFEYVSSTHNAPLVPFFLAGVAGVPALNLADGIHPTAPGHVKIAETVAPQLWALLDSR